MIRLREWLRAWLEHPVAGPLVLLVLALMLAFVFLHTLEHGVGGVLFGCVMLVAGLRLAVEPGRRRHPSPGRRERAGRAPPIAALPALGPRRVPVAELVLPLRR